MLCINHAHTKLAWLKLIPVTKIIVINIKFAIQFSENVNNCCSSKVYHYGPDSLHDQNASQTNCQQLSNAKAYQPFDN